MAFLSSRANIRRRRANIRRRRANIRHSRVSILHHLKVSIRSSRQRPILRLPMGSLRIGSPIRRSMLSNPMFRKKVEMLLSFQAGLFCGFGSTRE